MKGNASRRISIDFGEYGLKAITGGRIPARQIEAARRAISRYTKRSGKLWIRIFPDKPVTKKSAGVRMGGGKGDVDHYVSVVRPGTIIFELAGVTRETAVEAMRLARHKLAVKTKFVVKE